jgi:hypothetical protein
MLAICAPGMRPLVATPAVSALVSTVWGVSRVQRPWDTAAWPSELRGRRDVPPACRVPAT